MWFKVEDMFEKSQKKIGKQKPDIMESECDTDCTMPALKANDGRSRC